MRDALLRLALRVPAAIALVWVVQLVTAWWVTAFVFSSVGLAALFARPLLELAGRLPWAARFHLYRHVAGRHAEYRGHAIDILEDEDCARHLSLRDVRRCVPGLPAYEVLKRLEATGVHEPDRFAPEGRIEGEALARVLARTTDPNTGRFLHWLARDVTGPARTRRGRLRGLPAKR